MGKRDKNIVKSKKESSKDDLIEKDSRYINFKSYDVDMDKLTIKQIFEYAPITWKPLFDELQSHIDHISNVLYKKGLDYYPKSCDLLNAFFYTPLFSMTGENNPSVVKVVIIGMDPYYTCDSEGEPTAMGMSFSVRKGLKIPPSLLGIYEEIENNYPDTFIRPDHGYLVNWALQGVLMLNTALTVSPGKSGTHISLWDGFTTDLIEKLTDIYPSLVFLLFGQPAHRLADIIPKSCHIIKTSHPVPYQKTKAGQDYPALIGSGCFKQVNDILESQKKTPIDWNVYTKKEINKFTKIMDIETLNHMMS